VAGNKLIVAIITSRVHDDHMTHTVIHQPRVAWDGARAFIRAAASEYYGDFAAQVFERLGKAQYDEYERTREHVFAALTESPNDRRTLDIEAGKWRVRLEEMLREHPDLVPEVLTLTGMAPHY
jgi:hypothetical protein